MPLGGTGGVGPKPGATPVTTNSNNTGITDQSGAGRGNFGPPGPNTKWLPTVPSDAAKAKRAEAEANGTAITIGDSEARHARGEAIKAKTAALSAAAPINNQQSPESSDDSTSGVGDIVEEAAKSSEAALKAEEKHDDEVAARRTQELKDLHQDMQLSTTGTTAPAA